MLKKQAIDGKFARAWMKEAKKNFNKEFYHFEWDNVFMLLAWVFQPTNVLVVCATIITVVLLRMI